MLNNYLYSIAEMKLQTTEQQAINLSKRFIGINKAKFARENGLSGGASMLSQHLSGHRPISLEAAIIYAKGLGCTLYDISPRLYEEIENARNVGLISQKNNEVRQELTQYSTVEIIDDDCLQVPMLNAVASMGNGNHQEDVEVVIEMLTLNKNWASQTLKPFSNLENLTFIHAIGDSMHPTFNDGDVLMVDAGDKSITADKIYVLEAHGRLFIKRVRQRLDGVYEISSDNPSIKTVDVLNGEHEVNIKGRVIWVWNGRKL